MMMGKIILGLALCVACCNAQRYQLLGTQGDPCVEQQANTLGPDTCATLKPLPPSATTAYLPVNTNTLTTLLTQATVSQATVPSTAVQIGLAAAGATVCGTPDATFQVQKAASGAFIPPATWRSAAMQIEAEPRLLCIAVAANQWRWTGLRIAAVFQCGGANQAAANLQCSSRTTIQADSDFNAIRAGPPVVDTTAVSAEVAKRTVCCMGSAPVTDSSTPATGICIDERTTSCCGGRGMFKGSEKCCRTSTQVVRAEADQCPCTVDTDCSTGTTCCRATKYANLAALQTEGRCFGGTERCCDTGSVYNPETQQCCVVSGLQKIEDPCPCGSDADCVGGQAEKYPATSLSSGRCCKAFNPAIREETKCNKFTNTPSQFPVIDIDQDGIMTPNKVIPGQITEAQMDLQRCPGRCIDSTYQICCNSVVCHQEYEKCCDSTCCNKFTSHCAEGLVGGSIKSMCSRTLNLDPIRAFMVYALPTFLLVSTLLAFALVLSLSQTVTSRVYSYIEISLMLVASLVILFAIPTFFSPSYKYGVLIVLAALLAFLAGTSRTLWLNALSLAAIGLAILFVFNPFGASTLLDLSSVRDQMGDATASGSGLEQNIWMGQSMMTNGQTECTTWYAGYFSDDMNLKDSRLENPEDKTYGYCSRAWATVLSIVQAITLGLLVILFAVAALALVLRCRKVSFDSVEGL